MKKRLIDGVAISKGSAAGRGDPGRISGYAGYTKAKAKSYAGQARAKAAAKLKGGY